MSKTYVKGLKFQYSASSNLNSSLALLLIDVNLKVWQSNQNYKYFRKTQILQGKKLHFAFWFDFAENF